MTAPDVPHVVYLHRDNDGNVLYVGATSHLGNRTGNHRGKSPWWPHVASVAVDSEHANWVTAHQRERYLIAFHEPPHNTMHNPRGDADRRRWEMRAALEDPGPVTMERLRAAAVVIGDYLSPVGAA